MIRRGLLIGGFALCLSQSAAAWIAQAPTAVAGYTGPGDLATFSAWYGLRAFSSADRGVKLVSACNSTGGGDVCADLLSDATTGALVSQSINGGTCPGVNCTIQTWYVKGNGNGVDVTQATVGSRATLPASCATTSKPCATFVRGSHQFYGAASTPATTLTQPYTIYGVFDRTGSTTLSSGIVSSSNTGGTNTAFIGSGAGTNLIKCTAGTTTTAAANDSTWHVAQFLANGASSDCNIDGSTNTVSAGTNSLSLRAAIGGENYADNSSNLDGLFVEGGIGAGTLASLNSNAKTYWGF